MQAYRIETTPSENRTLTLNNLPFSASEPVEVIILPKPSVPTNQKSYPLRGKLMTYVDPTEPVAEGDWEIMQ